MAKVSQTDLDITLRTSCRNHGISVKKIAAGDLLYVFTNNNSSCEGEDLQFDASCILLCIEVFEKLHLPAATVSLTNLKIWHGLAEAWEFSDKFEQFAISMDKWKKNGEIGLVRELGAQKFTETQIHAVQHLFRLKGTNEEKLSILDSWFTKSNTGQNGLAELRALFQYFKTDASKTIMNLDPGFFSKHDFYPSTIFELQPGNNPFLTLAIGGHYSGYSKNNEKHFLNGFVIRFGEKQSLALPLLSELLNEAN